jgi:hypothetical protein
MTSTLAPVPARSLRGANIVDLIGLLQAQHRQKVDVVIPLATLLSRNSQIELAGIDPVMDENGVTDVSGAYRITASAVGQLASILDIPVKYLRRLVAEHTSLFDTNVNEWALRADRKILIRALYGSDPAHPDTNGIIRAFLSDSYGMRDNLDFALAVLDGMREGGLGADNIRGADLSDDRLWLRVHAPEMAVAAPELTKDYRSPFTGAVGAENPLIHAGIIAENSETGGGALKVTPELIMKVCNNGMKINTAAMRKIHLGTKLDEGTITWSADTVDAGNELVKLQVRDAVKAFLTAGFVEETVRELEKASGTTVDDPTATVTVVAKKLGYTDDVAKGILQHFMASVVPSAEGLQYTAGHVMHAVTSYAQEIEDPALSNEVGGSGVEAMLVAAGR